MTRKILILDAGDAPYPLTVARSLGSAGHEVYLGFSYGSHIFSAYSKYCKGHLFYPDPLYASTDFVEFFKGLGGKYDFIIPTMEKSQLPISTIKEHLEKAGTSVPIPDHETLSVATNKALMLEVASKNGVPIPPTLILAEEPNVGDVVKKISIPFIMKVATEINVPPGPRNRYFVVKNKISQHEFSVLFRKLLKHGPVILQQYIKGIGIGASFIFSRNGELIGLFGHKRILERFPEGGPSVIAETFYHPEAIKYGIKLLRALKWQGVVMTEFKLGCDGKLYFMELNPRFWGTLPLAIASGIDFPRLLAEYYNFARENDLSHTIRKKKVFVKSLTIPYLLLNSIKTKDFAFSKKIISSSLKIFKYGFPFIVELEKLDLVPAVKELTYTLRNRLSRKNISRLSKVSFGPALSYGRLKKLGVKSIIDLREEREKSSVIVPHGMSYYSFPIEDDSAPSLASFSSLTSLIDRCLQKGKVCVHCRLGRGRAPMTVIAYLISKGLSLEAAYKIVYDTRPYTYLNSMQKKALYDFYKKCHLHDEKGEF